MAAGTHLNDAGTWRKLRNIYVNDLGTWRALKSAYVNDAGTWRQVFSASDLFTLTAGQGTIAGPIVYTGYDNNGYPWSNGVKGSLSSAILGDGMTVQSLNDSVTLNQALLIVRGFSADPGTGYLTSLLINGITKLGSAAGYSWQPGGNTGWAMWVWSGSTFGMTNGGVYPVELVRG